MKNQKRQPVSVVPCPECNRGSAVKKSEAYRAFHSKKYSKRRKARKSAEPKRAPQVGRDTNIEYVLTDPSFAERVTPPKLFYEDDDFIPKIIIWGVAIITFPIAIAYLNPPKNTPSIAAGLDGDEFGIVGASPTINSGYYVHQLDVKYSGDSPKGLQIPILPD